MNNNFLIIINCTKLWFLLAPLNILAVSGHGVQKYRFSKDQIDKLISIKWWDWDDRKIVLFYVVTILMNL